MCLSGAAGAAVGEALIRPTARRPAPNHSNALAACRSGKSAVLVPVVLLLVGSGLIEGYISPNPGFLAASADRDRRELLAVHDRPVERLAVRIPPPQIRRDRLSDSYCYEHFLLELNLPRWPQ